ncbi:MAG: VWA domain-containing protein, partial [Proteobacteria bacterium]|nr:VWA domain-containing protein [Pseudomonadota bacterium]
LKGRYVNKTGFSAVSFINKKLEPNIIKKYGIDVLGILFMIIAILALVNVQYSSVWQKTCLESKWIMIVQDLSGSMNRASSERGLTLGDVALNGARAFINMRHKDDLVGVIAFSSYAKLIAPPTFDKEILKEKVGLLSRESDSIVFRELTVGGATNASYATWLALCTFFMLLPEENQLSFEELKDFRYSLLGNTIKKVEIPEKLKKIKFGHGMAIVLFTDGRIEANKKDEDVRRGLPNFVNVVKLIEKLGVKLYLIVVGGEVNDEVQTAIEGQEGNKSVGRIFYMPRRFSLDKMEEVYSNINELEKNRLLVKMHKKKKETRWLFACIGMFLLASYCFLRLTPWFRKI